MAKDRTGFGLLSRVVGLVRRSTSGWGESEPEAERESQYSKQMLKEMIERKRRNDFVRRREFDMLRKLRRSEALAGNDMAARPSFFQSSLPSKPDDRATTLKKIDEIEAQMSMQWWKTRHGDAPRPTAPSGPMPLSTHVPLGTGGSARGHDVAPHGYARPPADAGTTLPDLLPLDFDLLGSGSSGRSSPPPPPPAPTPEAARAPAAGGRAAVPPPAPDAGAHSTFSASKVFAIDVEEFAHDPELEEAAIRFANGDDDGTEAGLLDVLRADGPRAEHEETWLTLFDFYRASGRQERYEPAAIDFARRFGRSAPQWFSMPDQVHGLQPAGGAAGSGGLTAAHWSSPAQLGAQTVAGLNAALERTDPPWVLNWTKLAAIADAAVEPLAATFARWAAQPVQLRFVGADVLQAVLKEATPSGDRHVEPAWWKLRLEVLRVLHRPDEFELVALDYCVTYEVSPPSWEGARCDCKPVGSDGLTSSGHTFISEAFRDSLASAPNGDAPALGTHSQLSAVATVELAGQILGDGSETLALLEERMGGADMMVIACDRLIRIDFTAAGTLLNWVVARCAEGRQVQFVEVHRLVGAFFNVIGISEHARVIVRQD